MKYQVPRYHASENCLRQRKDKGAKAEVTSIVESKPVPQFPGAADTEQAVAAPPVHDEEAIKATVP